MGNIKTASLGFLQLLQVNFRNGSQTRACPLCFLGNYCMMLSVLVFIRVKEYVI
jgi:hypothetical protein